MQRILVVEDDSAIRELVAQTLRDAGFTVAAASDGAAGLTLLRTFRPDALFLDLDLPQLDGRDLLRAARTEGLLGRAAVALVSAVPDLAGIATESRVEHWLAKPFSLEAIEALAARLLGLRRGGTAPPPRRGLLRRG